VKRMTTLAALVVALAATLATAPAPADAAVSSASLDGTIATLSLDGANDEETVSVSGGLLVHSSVGGGLESNSDWSSAPLKVVTVPADGTVSVVVNGGDGNDSLTVVATNTEIAGATLNGDAGDDVLRGADTSDTLNGGDGNDLLIGGKGIDVMSGGRGDDTFVWNDGDGSDRLNGDAGTDTTEVNGSATLGDVFTLDPVLGGVRFLRTNLVPFKLDTATERFRVNGLGGGDSVAASDGVGGHTLLSVDGGTGADTISGSDGPDLIIGGEGNDVLAGGGGSDTISGGAGDDQVDVRDNTADVASGGEGNDSVVADAVDLDILDGFETVDRPVVAPPPVVIPPPVLTAPPGITPPPVLMPPSVVTTTRRVTIRGGTANARKGTVSIKVTCPATSGGNCTGSLVLRIAKGVKVAGLRIGLQIGSARYNLPPGASKTLKVRLARGTRRIAARTGRLKVLAIASTGHPGAIARSSQRLTLVLGAASRRK
jgi:Ca2+-binding RTX toxin-like protein